MVELSSTTVELTGIDCINVRNNINKQLFFDTQYRSTAIISHMMLYEYFKMLVIKILVCPDQLRSITSLEVIAFKCTTTIAYFINYNHISVNLNAQIREGGNCNYIFSLCIEDDWSHMFTMLC